MNLTATKRHVRLLLVSALLMAMIFMSISNGLAAVPESHSQVTDPNHHSNQFRNSILGPSINQPADSGKAIGVDAIFSGQVALFGDLDPWSATPNKDILNNSGIPYGEFGTVDIGIVDLSLYDKVILRGGQDATFYTTLEANLAWLESYVINGGLLEIHMASNLHTVDVSLPYGVGYTWQWPATAAEDVVVIEDQSHQIINSPSLILDGSLDGNSYTPYGYFSNLPGNENTIVSWLSLPNVVEFDYGEGNILLMAGSYEYGWVNTGQLILENMILFEPEQDGDILVLYADDDNNGQNLAISLYPFGHDVNVQSITQNIPSLSFLQQYMVVISWSAFEPFDAVKWGDLLADYADTGGNVILGAYSFSQAPYLPEGRFLARDYHPFDPSVSSNFTRNYDGLSNHPIFSSIPAFSTTFSMQAVLDRDAFLIASYTGGTPLAAIKQNVLGINTWFGSLSVNLPNLISESIDYMTYNIPLLMYGDDVSGATVVSTYLNNEGITVDLLDIRSNTPSLGDLMRHPLVVIYTNNAPGDPAGLGDALANYLDMGGSVVAATFAFTTFFEVTGRLVLDGYSPFIHTDWASVNRTYDGLSVHPILAGVSGLSSEHSQPMILSQNSTSIANYTDGTPLMAMKNGFIGFNAYPVLGWTGDIDRILANSINFLLVGVDSDPPLIQSDPELIFEFGSEIRISWVLFDNNPTSYTISDLNGIVQTGSWSNGERIEYFPQNLGLGIHTFTLNASDIAGNIASSTVSVNIMDTTPPVILSTGNLTLAIGEPSNGVKFELYDSDPNEYQIFIDDVSQGLQLWTNGEIVIVSVTGFSTPGLHNITIEVSDGSGNLSQETIFVIVSDSSPPEILGPNDIELGLTEFGVNITWILRDDNPDSYRVTVNKTEIDSGTWSDGDEVNVNLDGLKLGTYLFHITATDLFGGFTIDEVKVTIFDKGIPTITHPFDIFFVEGETGHSITWLVGDDDPTFFTLYENHVPRINDSWTFLSFIEVKLDGLAPLHYNFTLELHDGSGNVVSDSVSVQVFPADANPSDSTESGDETIQIDIDPVVAAGVGAVIFLAGGTWAVIRRRG